MSHLAQAIPGRAVLVFYCPDTKRLADTWDIVDDLRRSDDPILDVATARLDRLQRKFLRAWSARLRVTAADLIEALPGEIAIGWMPRRSDSEPAFDPDNWVLVTPRQPDTEAAVRRLWQQLAQQAPKGHRVEHLRIDGLSVEQLVWEETSEADLSPTRAPRLPEPQAAPPAPPVGAGAFGQVTRIERRALSFGRGEGFLYFAPGRADQLEPWARAVAESRQSQERRGRLEAAFERVGRRGEVLLAIQAEPPAWVPPVQSSREQRLGAHPARVLYSQMRTLDVVLAGSGRTLSLDAHARFLPPPGWAARLLAGLRDGAVLLRSDDLAAQVVLRADFAQLWRDFHAVLREGWPVVAVAVDSFVEPLAGKGSLGLGSLAAALGGEMRLLILRPAGNERRASWAFAADVRDADRVGLFEPGLVRLLETVGGATMRYGIGQNGQLVPPQQATPTTAPAFAPRFHIALSPSRFAVAGSPRALQEAMILTAGPTSPAAPSAPPQPLWAALSRTWGNRPPAVLFQYEARESRLPLGFGRRRVIRTPTGTLELISPPKDADAGSSPPVVATSAEPTAPAVAARDAVAVLVGALLIESERTVRLQIGLQCFGEEGKSPRPLSAPTKKEPIIDE